MNPSICLDFIKECYIETGKGIYNALIGDLIYVITNYSRVVFGKPNDLEVIEFAKRMPRAALTIYITIKFASAAQTKLAPVKETGEVLNPKDIHFMQNSAKNIHPGSNYTVLGNAEALKNGTLKPSDIPTIRVWKDSTTGKIWTLDHRRLVAFRLAGIEKISVIQVLEEWVKGVEKEWAKMTTKTGGLSIKLKLGDGIYIIVE